MNIDKHINIKSEERKKREKREKKGKKEVIQFKKRIAMVLTSIIYEFEKVEIP